MLDMKLLGDSSSDSSGSDINWVVLLKMIVSSVAFIYFPYYYLAVGEISKSRSSPIHLTQGILFLHLIGLSY